VNDYYWRRGDSWVALLEMYTLGMSEQRVRSLRETLLIRGLSQGIQAGIFCDDLGIGIIDQT